MFRRRHWANAPETEEAVICAELGADRHRRRNPREDQQRRHQEAAADAEQAREEADRAAHGQENEDVRRHLGDGQIEVHTSPRCPTDMSRMPRAAAPHVGAPARRHQVGFGSRPFRPPDPPMSATDARYGSMSRSAGSAKGLPGRGWPRGRKLTPRRIRTPCARELQARRQENHEEWSGVRPSRIRHPAMCSFRDSVVRACRCAHDRSRSREPGTLPRRYVPKAEG